MSTEPQPASVHRVGVVEIDVLRRCIRHAGRVVPVEPKTFDLLLYFVLHADHAVRRQELMDALWPGVVVSEDTLSSAIRRVRDALGPERQRLQVLRRVGYRFVAADPAADVAHPGLSGAAEAEPPRPSESERELAATPYVGRGGDLAALYASLERGLEGRGCFVSLSGDAGSGKSRTAEELVRHARGLGAEVIQARCYEGDGGQPLWPWVQVFRQLAASRDATQLAEVLGAEARDVGVLTAAIAGPDGSAPADPAMQRVRLFDSAVAVLRRSAGRRSLFLVFDDLHWADAASLLLLRALADGVAGLPMVILGTHRDAEVAADHPLADLIAELRRQRMLHHVRLGNLDFAEVASLLRNLAGHGPGEFCAGRSPACGPEPSILRSCATAEDGSADGPLGRSRIGSARNSTHEQQVPLFKSPAAAEVDDAIAVAVHAATEGNPLFVREYWYDLVETEAVVCDAGVWRGRDDVLQLVMPTTVSEIIGRRLQRLRRATHHVLSVAATIGRDFSYDLVRRVSDLAPDDIIESLDEATAAGVVEDAAAGAGSYRFTHALVRQGLYESMTPMRRAALHRAVGEALRATSSADIGPDRVAELAHHFLNGAPAGGHEAAVDFAIQAAHAATHACAYDEAVHYLRQAIAVADMRSPVEASQRRRCELQLLFAEALGRAGDGVAMRQAFDVAALQARALPAPELLARAAIGMTAHWVAEDETAVARLEEALAALPAGDVALRARTGARLAKTLYFFADTRSRREQLCEEARALATDAANANALADVLADSLEALFHSDGLPQQDELVAALGDAADVAGDKRLRLVAEAWRIVNAMRHGKLTDADAHLSEFSRLALDLRQPRFLHHAASFDAALLLARARLDEAETRIDEALRLGERIDAGTARWIHWVHLYHLRAEQGRLEEFLGEGLALRLPPATMGALSFQRASRWAAPHVFCELGREDEARASFESLMAAGLDTLPPENSRNVRIAVLFSLGSACVTIGDEKSAAPIYDRLAPYADQWHVVGWGNIVYSSTHMMLGALSAVQKRWAVSAEHFAEATRQHESQNAVCAQARLLYNHARVIRRRGRRTDQRHAARMIDEGLQLARAHGLQGLLRRLQRLGA